MTLLGIDVGTTAIKISALERAGIEAILAQSPQAKGRVERGFETLQDRLPKELRVAGVTSRARVTATQGGTATGRRRGAIYSSR